MKYNKKIVMVITYCLLFSKIILSTNRTIEIYGTLTNNGTTENFDGGTIINYNQLHNDTLGTFWNYGTIDNNEASLILNDGTFNNQSPTGTINNNGEIDNQATFNNQSTLTNNEIINNYQTMSNSSPIYNNNAFNNYGTFTNNGEYINNSGIANHDTFINSPSGELTNDGEIFNLYNSNFLNTGIIEGSGQIHDMSDAIAVFPNSVTMTITEGLDIVIYQPQRVSTNGTIFNNSENTITIYGELYTYSFIKNGDVGTPGIINIAFPGSLFLLNAHLENYDINSTVSIQPGANLYNYYGNIITDSGFITLKPGGNFDNVRGNHLGTFNIFSGGHFTDNEHINLNRDLDIDLTWTITQNTTINGYGYTINFGPLGKIYVPQGVSLKFDDIILNGLSNNKIQCLDNNSTVSLNDVTWIQDDDFFFDQGNLFISGEWLIKGDGTTFNYESSSPSTINTNAIIHLIQTTFNYNSPTPNLLQFEDETAILMLEHATLKATQNFTPSVGTLITKGLGTLIGDGYLNLSYINNIDVIGSLRRSGNVLILQSTIINYQ